MTKPKLNKTISITILIIIVLVIFIITKPNPIKPSSYKCPREYKTNQEYYDGIDTWITEVTTKNPKITDEEIKIQRDRLFKENNCEQGYWVDNTQTDGSPNGTVLSIPEPMLTESEKNELKTYTNDLGFSFRYPFNMSIQVVPKLNPENTQIIAIRPKNTKNNSIIISIANNDENISPEEWLLGSNSGFKVSDAYHMTTIDGQNTVYTDNNMWFVVNTPDNKYRLSITDLNPDENPRLFKEMNIIITSLKFNNQLFSNTNNIIDNLFKCPIKMSSFQEYADNRAEVMALMLKNNPKMSKEEVLGQFAKLSEKNKCSNDVSYLNEYRKYNNQ